MMSANKLEQITRELFEQGLEKGEAEGRKIIENARKQAAQMIAEAEAKAQEIERKAMDEAKRQQNKLKNEVQGQLDFIIDQLQVRVSEMLSLKSMEASGLLLDSATIWQQSLQAMFSTFATSPSKFNDLGLLLPSNWEAELTQSIRPAIAACLEKGLKIEGTDSSPFTISLINRQTGYQITLDAAEIKSFLNSRISRQTRQLLFS